MFSSWTEEQKRDMRQVGRYAIAIFTAIAIALLVMSALSPVLSPLLSQILDGDTATSILAESTPVATEDSK